MKKYTKYLPLLAIIPFLVACGSSSSKKTSKKRVKARAAYGYDMKDTNGLDILTGQFSHNIDDIW